MTEEAVYCMKGD